ncbi:DEAD/DEAH box helicase [Synechococcus sp. PCC 7336]|uniref:DEAD/DEAH box helicase n=1 Tax=Synechococcus sp. PCC 7336 TaxID=195250 RepID=UPI00034B2CED|nr:DEAD/DEAH box helicase [Synechococcus sp. PCC 7336]
MKILHGTWIPHSGSDFIQTGEFYLWAETAEPQKRRKRVAGRHPFQLEKAELVTWLSGELRLGSDRLVAEAIAPKYFHLPSGSDKPLPSPELARYWEADWPEAADWQLWEVDCYEVKTRVKTGQREYRDAIPAIKLLNDLHFIALHQSAEVQFGNDLLFWYHYTRAFAQAIFKDQYIPALRYRELSAPKSKGRRKKSEPEFELYPTWEFVSEQYETNIHRYVEHMPAICTCGFDDAPKTPQLWDKETLLRHFSEVLLDDIVTHTPSTNQFDKTLADTLLAGCFQPDRKHPWRDRQSLELYRQWQDWRQKLARTQTATSFYLGFQLEDPGDTDEPWELFFVVADRQDPSHRMLLADYWLMDAGERQTVGDRFGADFEQQLLVHLGYAARMYPLLWQALDRMAPFCLALEVQEAFEFLTEFAWVLEDAGFKVIVPSWWTPAGRRRAKVKLRPKQKSSAGKQKGSKSYFGFDQLVDYEYQLAIGDEPVSNEEWEQLVEAQTPLVLFRGEWVEIDPAKMKEMLEFWRSQPEDSEMSLLDLVKLEAQQQEEIELDLSRDRALADWMDQLRDPSKLEVLPNPENLQGTLREYQQRGLSWLSYLENLGLNGCLADDMGLGKTIQVIARLVQEREEVQQQAEVQQQEEERPILPTLLVVPTSVVGNWKREIEKFAPDLCVAIHHGSNRNTNEAAFQKLYDEYDVIITSFTLARKDQKLLNAVEWHRIVLDEAQNIKNPKAAQTKAILKLSARHRLALTGTPVENRLMDLWSIFNFLNPGYLGNQTQFRKSFEIPIQKNSDLRQSATLKKLVEPFILRRMKTDRNIIKDLPDKVEQKVYCNLTKEQASLYEAVVKQISGELEQAEGMSRRGLILSSLMKLKQICNHPRQFLQDGSDFTTERSHKLSRLTEMVAEAISEGESLLIFTQFTEIGEALEHYLRHHHLLNTYYLHGGTSRKKREQMIAEFQEPETEPSAFILSLKAGGVGITLTKANHVFHFDRWWNPAVEDQATDRAFRIGQTKNVFVHKFVAIGTLEERIDEMIEDKKKLAGAVVGSDESWLTELDNEAFQQLIALNTSAVL